MDEKHKNVRGEKVDAADAKDSRETYLPGQIPVEEAEANDVQNPEERQPDPVQAEQAVNPELQGAERTRRKPEPEATPAEDRRKR
jgi:hypothetical protein